MKLRSQLSDPTSFPGSMCYHKSPQFASHLPGLCYTVCHKEADFTQSSIFILISDSLHVIGVPLGPLFPPRLTPFFYFSLSLLSLAGLACRCLFAFQAFFLLLASFAASADSGSYYFFRFVRLSGSFAPRIA